DAIEEKGVPCRNEQVGTRIVRPKGITSDSDRQDVLNPLCPRSSTIASTRDPANGLSRASPGQHQIADAEVFNRLCARRGSNSGAPEKAGWFAASATPLGLGAAGR